MRTRLGLLALATALVLTACGNGGSADTNTDTAASTEPTASAPAGQAGSWGTPVEVADGVSVTISAPAAFTPGSFASNYLPGQLANILTIDVKNAGTAAFDMSTISLAPASAGTFCTDVLDGDNGVIGAPTEPVAAGGSVSFKYGIACDAKAGDPLTVGVTIADTTVNFEGTLA